MTEVDTNLISDGYHTFGELYEHRFALFLALCRHRTDAWKSRVHSDGTSYPGWFLVCIGWRPGEQISYHFPDAWWDRVGLTEERPPPFDGHTSADVLTRLAGLLKPWPCGCSRRSEDEMPCQCENDE